MSEASRPIRLLREAQIDVTAAFNWYEAQRFGLGLDFLSALSDAVQAANRSPGHYPVLADNIRRVLIRGFPYGVFFVDDDNGTLVTGVIHARRNLHLWRPD